MPAQDETTSTMVTAPCLRAMGPMSQIGFKVPEGVSECTTDTTVISGCSVR